MEYGNIWTPGYLRITNRSAYSCKSYYIVICEWQVKAVFHFVTLYALQVSIFVYCYGHIFYTIRRQSKAVAGHAGRNQHAGTSRDQTAGEVQQQATQATTGVKLSRTETNVLQTMMLVIVFFIICWTPASFAITIALLTVSIAYIVQVRPNIAIFIMVLPFTFVLLVSLSSVM